MQSAVRGLRGGNGRAHSVDGHFLTGLGLTNARLIGRLLFHIGPVSDDWVWLSG